MHPAHTIAKPRATQGQGGHIEQIGFCLGGAQGEQLLGGNPHFHREGFQVAQCQHAIELVVPGRNRRVRGENLGRGHGFQGACQVEAGRHHFPAPFQHHEGSMTFIHVPNPWMNAQLPQNANPTHTQHQLLGDAGGVIPTIELVGGGTVCRIVLDHIGIQKIEPHMTDTGLPDAAPHHTPREGNAQAILYVVIPPQGLDG